jgi:hypothetical protein
MSGVLVRAELLPVWPQVQRFRFRPPGYIALRRTLAGRHRECNESIDALSVTAALLLPVECRASFCCSGQVSKLDLNNRYIWCATVLRMLLSLAD